MQERTLSIDLSERERKEAAASRRFPVSISSETPVPRRDAYGETWAEVLSHNARAVDLSRAPLPVIEGHDRSKVNVGIVSGLRLDGSKLRGELVLGASARAGELAEDIAAGIVRNLSIGYQIAAEERDEKAKRITATRWAPYEVSIVSVPADTTVGIGRSHTVEEQTSTTPPTDVVSPEVLAERERATSIHDLVARVSLGADLAAQLVRDGTSIDRASAIVLDRLAARDEAHQIRNHVRMDGAPAITPGNDYAQDFQRAAVDSLLLRAGIRLEKPHAAARDVSGSVFDLARVCLSRSGKSASRMFGGEAHGPELIKRAMTTSDFPNILVGSLNAAIRNGYESEPSSHRAWVRPVPVADFRTQDRPILGSAPALLPVSEHAEYHDGPMSDDKASYSVAKYGVIVSLSWEALVNDNLAAFLRVQPALGQAARRKEADTVYALFALNADAGPTMQDGTALFHADHANLVTPAAALDSARLGAGRALLRKQTALSGGYLSLVPRFLIVPPEKESVAELLLANAARPASGSDKTVGAWIGSLELVVEPRLAAGAVFLAADTNQIDTCELGLLEENVSGPMVEEEQEFRKDVKNWKVRHVFGAKFLDWRGIVKMAVT